MRKKQETPPPHWRLSYHDYYQLAVVDRRSIRVERQITRRYDNIITLTHSK